MKKLFFTLLITILMTPSCFAYSEDSELQACMKNGNYTTATMMQCTYNRGNFYKNLSKMQIKKLKNKLSPAEYEKLIQNQNLFELYAKSLDAGALEILSSTMGSIYPTMASGIYYQTYYDNTKILDMLLSKQKFNDELLNQIPISKMSSTIDKKLALLKNNLTPTENNMKFNYKKAYIYNAEYNRYTDIEKSQKAWVNYFNDTKSNIIPMLKDYPDIQNYIQRMLYEDRISVLSTINAPFDDM